jgi:hypothetical protein
MHFKMRFICINSFIFHFLFFFFWYIPFSFSLSIDEKLPLRILKTSDTKKTVLINRGIEDGLAEGDHAKFFLTTGVVARGVLVKSSPSRSVWSLYRIVSENDIVMDKVMSLKITEAVKLTKDVSKMFSDGEEAVNAVPEGVVLVEGAQDLEKPLNKTEKKELDQLQQSEGSVIAGISNRTLEFWGTLHFSSLSSTNSTGSQGPSSSGSARGLDTQIGMEKYFLDYERWYGSWSFTPYFHYAKQEYSSLQGHTVSNSVAAFGLGLNWHFGAPPLAVARTIFFLGPSYGIGSATDSAHLQTQTTTQTLPALSGRVNFYTFGVGMKYYFSVGLGLRLMVDYYRRVESYAIAGQSDDYTKIVTGPRILLGGSYRF